MRKRAVSASVAFLLDPALTATAKILWTTLLLEGAPAPRVDMPAGLLNDQLVRPQAKLLFGLLQTLPTFSQPSGTFTFPALSQHTGLSPDTVRDAIGDLAAREWLEITQAHRKASVSFTLCDPDRIRRTQEVAAAAARLEDL